MRIPKEDFERWYRSQSRYRTAADRERDREIEAQTISIPEMAKLLGIPRKNVYGILDCKKYRDCFVIERVADRPRITKKSFKAFTFLYNSIKTPAWSDTCGSCRPPNTTRLLLTATALEHQIWSMRFFAAASGASRQPSMASTTV